MFKIAKLFGGGSKNTFYRRLRKMRKEETKVQWTSFRQDLGREFWLFLENRRVAVPYLSSVAAFIVICIIATVILNIRTDSFHAEASDLFIQNQKLEEEINRANVKHLEQVILREFPKEETNLRVNNNFSYKLYVNSTIPAESVVYTNQDKVTVELYEAVPKELSKTYTNALLQDASFIRGGSLPAKYIKVSCGNKEAKSTLITSGLDARLQISFDELETGDIVTIEITYGFSQRMGLENNLIEIIKR